MRRGGANIADKNFIAGRLTHLHFARPSFFNGHLRRLQAFQLDRPRASVASSTTAIGCASLRAGGRVA